MHACPETNWTRKCGKLIFYTFSCGHRHWVISSTIQIWASSVKNLSFYLDPMLQKVHNPMIISGWGWRNKIRRNCTYRQTIKINSMNHPPESQKQSQSPKSHQTQSKAKEWIPTYTSTTKCYKCCLPLKSQPLHTSTVRTILHKAAQPPFSSTHKRLTHSKSQIIHPHDTSAGEFLVQFPARFNGWLHNITHIIVVVFLYHGLVAMKEPWGCPTNRCIKRQLAEGFKPPLKACNKFHQGQYSIFIAAPSSAYIKCSWHAFLSSIYYYYKWSCLLPHGRYHSGFLWPLPTSKSGASHVLRLSTLCFFFLFRG